MGKVRLLLLITLLSMCVPFSMDIYMPALPAMVVELETSEMMLNSTIYLFQLFMAVGMIFLGPMSDKYGRKKMLVPAAAIYIIMSICCALAPSVEVLVACRMVQALGVGAMMTLCTAIIDDVSEGGSREKMLGLNQAMSLIAPAVAPLLGAAILTVFSWRATFVALAIFGLAVIVLAASQRETLPLDARTDYPALGTLRNLGQFFRDRSYMTLLVVTTIPPIGYMVFLMASSYLYQLQFGLSQVEYSFFYSANSCLAIVAALLYPAIRARLSTRAFMTSILCILLASGLLELLFGARGPVAFMICMLPTAFAAISLKPLIISMLLQQTTRDVGASTAALNFVATISNMIGFILGSVAWGNWALAVGSIMVIVCSVGLIGWCSILHSKKLHIVSLDE